MLSKASLNVEEDVRRRRAKYREGERLGFDDWETLNPNPVFERGRERERSEQNNAKWSHLLHLVFPRGTALHVLQHSAQDFVLPSGHTHLPRMRGFGNSY